ncbi:hypothetical protein [Halopseudomonas salegens]|uniref:Uncharacterized protein n=1 Tax=Halopseudomonas salegens TaxID=1434072 RepID=A0A1H2EW70_9GAMM|nr:hypothetical protein [Halopseudomonas salegens]SDT99299.1 hypothetical protein SAMN05216210_1086 [Halopseudomonas salegens]
MSMQYAGLAGVLLLLACILLIITIRIGWRLNWLLGWLRGQLITLLLLFTLVLGLIAWDLSRYQALPLEGRLFTVEIRATNAGHDLRLQHAGKTHVHSLQGDLWRLDLQVLRWQGLAHAIGLQDGYRPYRLSGRFLLLERQRAGATQLELHNTPAWRDPWHWLDGGSGRGWLAADAFSINFMPLADGARFAIEAGPTGLTPVPLNAQAASALTGQP